MLLEEYGNFRDEERPLLFTSDDRTEGYLDERYDELKDRFLFFNAGEAGRVTQYMDKNLILECAIRHGLKVLNTVVIDKTQNLAGGGYRVSRHYKVHFA